ncbi:unnamed protein product [Moneuplotes crassus]|uniref:Uncharacterized protein n=2 Tax=Euplotes crassus TaxID=5936 RepID=A0AAD2D428_EUPCR|nr:unnamed protein product [Moneuplotes crassus]
MVCALITKVFLISLQVAVSVSLLYHGINRSMGICPVRAPYLLCVANLHCRYNYDHKITFEEREYYNHCGHRDYVKSFPLKEGHWLATPYLKYFFEQGKFDYKHKKYFFDNEVAFGITRVEIGLILSFILITYVNYLAFVKKAFRILYKDEEVHNKRTGLATLFDNPRDQKPIWDKDAKPKIKNIWTAHEVQDKPNAVKIEENTTPVELSTEEIRELRLKRFNKKHN